jgi:hypothetical protein
LCNSHECTNVHSWLLLQGNYPNKPITVLFKCGSTSTDFTEPRLTSSTYITRLYTVRPITQKCSLPKHYQIIYGTDINDEKKLSDTLNYGNRIPPEELPMSKIDKVIIKRFPNMDPRGDDFFLVCVYPKPGVSLRRPEFYRLVEYIKGYYEAREFYAPRYKIPQIIHNPSDFRTTLYWVPDINTLENNHAKITFSNSDMTTKVRVVVQGVTEDGVPVFGSVIYCVKQ